MGTKHQCLVRLKGHPNLSKSFVKFSDAQRWGLETELKIRREEAGILKIKFPKFSEIALKYINEVSIIKKCFRDERYTIFSFFCGHLKTVLFNNCTFKSFIIIASYSVYDTVRFYSMTTSINFNYMFIKFYNSHFLSVMNHCFFNIINYK